MARLLPTRRPGGFVRARKGGDESARFRYSHRIMRGAPPSPARRRSDRSLKVTDAFKAFVLDQLEELGDVTPRSMFGGVGLYYRGVFFGILARDRLYLKVGDVNRREYEAAGMRPFRP